MPRALVYAAAAALVAGGLAGVQPAPAQQDAAAAHSMHATHDASHAAPAPAAAKATAGGEAAAPAASTLRGLALRSIADAQKKLISLAEAMPAEKYTWRPADKVRSVGEAFMHVAAANYFLPTSWGTKLPAGVDPRGLEKEGGDKAKTVAALKQSFDFATQAIEALPEAELGKAVQIFGRSSTAQEIVLGIATHAHEHLGQEIAYARMNGVVPPWSAAQGQGGP